MNSRKFLYTFLLVTQLVIAGLGMFFVKESLGDITASILKVLNIAVFYALSTFLAFHIKEKELRLSKQKRTRGESRKALLGIALWAILAFSLVPVMDMLIRVNTSSFLTGLFVFWGMTALFFAVERLVGVYRVKAYIRNVYKNLNVCSYCDNEMTEVSKSGRLWCPDCVLCVSCGSMMERDPEGAWSCSCKKTPVAWKVVMS